MQLSIRGKNEILSKKEVRKITYTFGELLLGQKLFPNISLTIFYTNNLNYLEWGYCNPLDDERKYHREFEFVLNPSICRKNQIKTIAHELVHMQQFARGKLKHHSNLNFTWMGKVLNPNRYKYQNIPWEKDAIQEEIKLYEWYKYNLKKEIDTIRRT